MILKLCFWCMRAIQVILITNNFLFTFKANHEIQNGGAVEQ